MSARNFGPDCITNLRLPRNQSGVPYVRYGRQQIVIGAPRLVYSLFVGAVQNGQAVSHRCGNKECINPDHLYLRSIEEATADQGIRQRLDARHHWYIRRSPLSLVQLGEKLGYGTGNLSLIRRRKAGIIERFSLRYALLILWERMTGKGRRQ